MAARLNVIVVTVSVNSRKWHRTTRHNKNILFQLNALIVMQIVCIITENDFSPEFEPHRNGRSGPGTKSNGQNVTKFLPRQHLSQRFAGNHFIFDN